MNLKSDGNLKINEPLAVELIIDHLQKLVKKQNTKGILLGLSGGIDSAILTTLAVKALGKEKVKVCFVFDRDSEDSSKINAEKMARWLGLELEMTDMSLVMRKKRVYSPLIMKAVPYSARFNRMIQHFYRFAVRENPFKTTLKVGANRMEKSLLKQFMFNLSIRHIDQGFSERHRYRRQLLEQKAADENLTLIGAANRSEFEVGWFVKEGIDDLPNQPMTGLYKTQIWQLAAYLNLPEEIQNQTPSPDMMRGIRDEFAIGYNYRKLDQMLDFIERKTSDPEIVDKGYDIHEIKDIRELMMLSAWKRASEHEPPPVHGGINGNVRLL
ncbi:MAG: NAD(+) synthase [Candidatus Marinimicrobia bacterium]|nr:NAD(+) synthase [Candidatus Neomarinimicrobiota bacterium]